MRRNRTFAYDLIVHYGAVNSRVVLLLRSIEAKPKMSPPSREAGPSFSELDPPLGGLLPQPKAHP